MKLLYFAPHQLWPLTTGARLRDYHLAHQLAQRCSVTFVEMLHRGDQYGPALPGAFTQVISTAKGHNHTPSKLLRGLAGPIPLTVLHCTLPRVKAQLAEALNAQYDTVQLENVHLSEYLSVVRSAPNRPTVLMDWHNIESELMQRYSETTPSIVKRLVARRTAVLLERLENRLLGGSIVHTVASERERDKLLARCPSARIHVIPNGVDTAHYVRNVAEPPPAARNHRRTLLFVGSMDYHANIEAVTWFVREVWPGIAATFQDVDFVIVGRSPAPEIRALASERIHVTGTVEDVRPFYNEAAAVVVPLRIGSGTRLKILEAMAAGVPVVSTRIGAEGIAVEDNVNCLLADTPKDLMGAIAQVLTSPEKKFALVEAGRKLVTSRYDWSIIGEQLFQIHRDLASRPLTDG